MKLLTKRSLKAVSVIAMSTGLFLVSSASWAQNVVIGSLVVGQVEAVWVQEGESVKKGQRLLKIDDAMHQASLKAALAQVNLKQVMWQDARVELDQALDLFDRTVTSKRTLDAAQLQHDISKAELDRAKAVLQQQQAWSKYYRITAPKQAKVVKVHAPAGSTVYKENSPLIELE